MLTLSFIHDFVPKKNKPKTMDRKTKASGSNFQAKNHPPHKALCEKFSTKKLYTEEIMSVSAVPNEVTRCVDNRKPNL